MQTAGKRVLSSLMSVVLVAGLCPAPAFADNGGSTSGENAEVGLLVAPSSDLQVSGGEESVDLGDADVEGVFDLATSQAWNSVDDAFPDLTVTLGGKELKQDTDYDIYIKQSVEGEDLDEEDQDEDLDEKGRKRFYSVPEEAGRYDLVIVPSYGSDYQGKKIVEFDVIANKLPLSDASIRLQNTRLLASGEGVLPVYWVSRYDSDIREDVPLVEGVDYTATIVKNKWDKSTAFSPTDPGVYYVRFDSCEEGGYVGTVFRPFALYAANDLTRATIDFDENGAWWYDSSTVTGGNAQIVPRPTVHLDGYVVDPDKYEVKFYSENSGYDSDYFSDRYLFDEENRLDSIPGRGFYYVAITGKGTGSEGYIGGTTRSFYVRDVRCLNDGYLSLDRYSYSLDDGVNPKPTVRVNGKTLQEGRDYTIAYYQDHDADDESGVGYVPVTELTEPGYYMAEATAVPGSGYYGSRTDTFRIKNPLSISDLEYTVNSTRFLASGEPVAFKVTFWESGATRSYDEEESAEGKLVEGKDYRLVFKNEDGEEIERPSAPGVYTVIAEGLGAYKGGNPQKWTVTIYARNDIRSALSESSSYRATSIYTGSGDVPGISLYRLGTDGRRGESLRIGVDFVIDSYKAVDRTTVLEDLDDVDEGTYYAVVKGLGEFEGSEVEVAFKVYDSKDLKNAEVHSYFGDLLSRAGDYWWSTERFDYTGLPVMPVRSVVLDGIPLLRGSDYEIEYYRDGQLVEKPIEPGTYSIRLVAGKNGKYVNTGSKENDFYQGRFTISLDEKDLYDAAMKVTTDCYYGTPVAATTEVRYKGVPLKEGVDYEVTYYNESNDEVVSGDELTVVEDGYRAEVRPAYNSGFTGSRTKRFSVKDATDLGSASFDLVAGSTQLLSSVQGSSSLQANVEALNGAGRKLTEGKDYELEFAALPDSDDYEVENLTYSAGYPSTAGRWYVRARGIAPFHGVTWGSQIEIVDVNDIAFSNMRASVSSYIDDNGMRHIEPYVYSQEMFVTGLPKSDGVWPYGRSYAYYRSLEEGTDFTVDRASDGSYQAYDKNHQAVEASALTVDTPYCLHAVAKAGSGFIGEKWMSFRVWSDDYDYWVESLGVSSLYDDDDDDEGEGLSVGLENRNLAWTGEGIDPGFVVTYNGQTLGRDADESSYDVTFYGANNYWSYSKTNPKTSLPAKIGDYIAYIVATVDGKTVTAERSFSIVNPYDLNYATIEGVDRYYTDRALVSAIRPVVKRADGVELTEGRDYELRLTRYDREFGEYVEVDGVSDYGEYTYTVYGLGDYVGRGTSFWFDYDTSYDDDSISIGNVSVDFSNVPRFTGTWFSVHPKVTLNGVELRENEDYYLYLYGPGSFRGCNVVTGVGDYDMELYGMGKYSGYASKTFTVHDPSYVEQTPTVSTPTTSPTNTTPAPKISLKTATVTGIPVSVAYAGANVVPVPVVKVGATTLRAGTDYTVSYSNNAGPGTASVTITAKGSAYTDSVTKTFTITKGSLSAAVISNVVSKAYDGKEHTQSPVVKLANGVMLTAGIDYTISYKNNKKAGTAVVTVTGTGKYKDSKSANFTIAAKSLAKAKVSGLKTVTYDGKQKKASLIVKVGKVKLVSGTDYAVKYKSNVNAGKASVVIQGKGNYSGKITKTFTIEKAKLSKATISVKAQKYKKGKACKPKPTVKFGKTSLKLNRDYTVSYKNNKKKGKATLTIKGKGNYTGSASKKFAIK